MTIMHLFLGTKTNLTTLQNVIFITFLEKHCHHSNVSLIKLHVGKVPQASEFDFSPISAKDIFDSIR